jgi:hypothetical protein
VFQTVQRTSSALKSVINCLTTTSFKDVFLVYFVSCEVNIIIRREEDLKLSVVIIGWGVLLRCDLELQTGLER